MPANPIHFPERVPFADGGWQCDHCATEIPMDQFIGFYSGTVFQVKGYQCPSCGHTSCESSVKSGNVKFDWRKMPVSRVPIGTKTMVLE